MTEVVLYDTTLRDGAQQEGISLSVEDKLKVARKLDDLGVHYVEGGWPASNPKDQEFFFRLHSAPLRRSRLVAFGSTRHAGVPAEQDDNLRALLEAGTDVVTLVGKASALHVTGVLQTTLEENLAMLEESVAFLKRHGRTVFVDAEHFFDGYSENAGYAVECLRRCVAGGADTVVLCDTNGGSLSDRVSRVVSEVRPQLGTPIGIHAHNDCDAAVASTLAAVQAGATQAQGTINGYGERCGNANLVSVIANLETKLGTRCLPEGALGRLTEVSRFVSEVANLPPSPSQPFVGLNAFGHKAGLHASAVARLEESYQHVAPERVGNSSHIVISEQAGRSNIRSKLEELGLGSRLPEGRVDRLLETVKAQESAGYQYEDAEASFELLVRRDLDGYRPPFALVDFLVLVESGRRSARDGDEVLAEAMVKLEVAGEVMHTAAEGHGPVNALDTAARKALLQFYPPLEGVRLTDYKVRVVNQAAGTAAVVRVVIESTDGEWVWRTVGCSEDIIVASWLALQDSLEWWVLRNELRPVLRGARAR